MSKQLAHFTTVLLLIFSYTQSHALLPEHVHYRVTIEIPLYLCDILGRSDSDALFVAVPGAIFTVIGNTGEDSIIVRFWKWKGNPAFNNELCFADSQELKRKYFRMGTAMLKNTECRYEQKVSFTAGNVLVPVKMRLQKFDFSKDFTLGPVAGIRMRLSHYTQNSINFLAGLGVTIITLNRESTEGPEEEDMDVPALTPSLGAVFDFYRRTQAGIFIGWDFVSHNDKRNFIYQGQTWISFGLGFMIVSGKEGDLVAEE